MQSRLLFLPGASGSSGFWQPVSDLLDHAGERILYGWPGFGLTPPNLAISGINDLVVKVVADIDRPTVLIAQSMGGVIAIRAALEKPHLVTHLVLTATSGGIDISDLGAQDWREVFHAENSTSPQWFVDYKEDLTEQLKKINIPVLLLWGDADLLSPVAVGNRLASLLPRPELHVIPGGDHHLAKTFAHIVTPLIDEYLARST